MARQEPKAEPTGTPGAAAALPDPVPSRTDAGGTTYAVSVGEGVGDGEVTFSRPGVEEHTFEVKGGTITTTKERAEWLIRYAGANPVPDKE